MVEANDSGGGFWSDVRQPQGSYQVYGQNKTVGAALAATGASGGFEFPSVDEMNAVLAMWKERQASISAKKNLIERARGNLTQLADDTESQGYLSQMRDSLDLLSNQHDSMLQYVENYIQKLTDATGAKQANEEANTAALKSGQENQG
ncbi:hypothetical protein FPZ12_004525 [Amycolatopsis acidicola]|uniref:PE domain-containing protein n=1 Tax=Amycolatopsis acidicola TaxID=2596893 RepID=A0A5N0VKS4_9PSEU|nr:hypothetical protein [Amycolatopsis acidicola]KAA9165760.1 hypothetical protein FPZ12_004525 [Amycolatopsis acidicola]